MRNYRRCWWIVPLVIALLAAAPADDADDLVRQGNAAFAREDYETAIKLYEQAEVLTTDPGLVAFNKAAALYRLGRYGQAELHYRCALEGATGPRRLRALYDLGNSLVKRAGGSNVRALQEAVGRYETVLREADADPDLLNDARDNLKVAKALLVQAQAAARKNESEPKDKDPSSEDSHPPKPDKKSSPQGSGDEKPESSKVGGADQTTDTTDPKQKPIPTDQRPQAGAGQQRVLEDNAQAPLTSAETEALLRRVWARIEKQRQQRQQHPAPASSRSAKDW
jgi:tetratricopeptide (TPR) repeat protein